MTVCRIAKALAARHILMVTGKGNGATHTGRHGDTECEVSCQSGERRRTFRTVGRFSAARGTISCLWKEVFALVLSAH
ncbi:hypothetical protein HMPREF1153_1470 [Selenomonas sp. CM52]|nr:hypothetical protein HMPREF1153_1470 [Selenomonas sp. CM52]